MRTIHWLGAGLSSIPGIRRLAAKNFQLIVWNRTLSKAEKSIDHVKSEQVKAQKYDFIDLENQNSYRQLDKVKQTYDQFYQLRPLLFF